MKKERNEREGEEERVEWKKNGEKDIVKNNEESFHLPYGEREWWGSFVSKDIFPFLSLSFLLFPLYLDTLLLMMVSERKRFFFVTRDNKLNREALREKKVREIEWKKKATMVRQRKWRRIRYYTILTIRYNTFDPSFFSSLLSCIFLSFFLSFLSHSFFLVTEKLWINIKSKMDSIGYTVYVFIWYFETYMDRNGTWT